MLARLIALLIHELATPIISEYKRLDAPPPPCPLLHVDASRERDMASTTYATTERAPAWDHDKRPPATALGCDRPPEDAPSVYWGGYKITAPGADSISLSRPYRLRLGSLRFTYRWRSWGCQRGHLGAHGHPNPVAAYRSLRAMERQQATR
ncbi:MAG TPA: hypothetical protein VFQ44_01825 [Streptosporangiaceae bacterium]|nr:hypothetical protein [Streptosporangiaceae bacterium]